MYVGWEYPQSPTPGAVENVCVLKTISIKNPCLWLWSSMADAGSMTGWPKGRISSPVLCVWLSLSQTEVADPRLVIFQGCGL